MFLIFFYNVITVIFIIFFLISFVLPLYIIRIEKFKGNYFFIFILYALSLFLAYILYDINYLNHPLSKCDTYRISNISININTFKSRKNRFPEEKDFYSSEILKNSMHQVVYNGEKILTPFDDIPVNIINKNNSLSISYTYNYDDKFFLVPNNSYRYCLNMPVQLKERDNIKNMTISINGKDFDYKTATKESMKDICYSDKPNSYTLTFSKR
ncbi:hypothetical protein PVE54_001087 [Salmonella enterica]|nr:hypothetical protein [Salmonella enterica]